jgi:hypothetical protein
MLRDEAGRGAQGLEPLRESPVEHAALPPEDVAVDGLAGERVSEGADPRLDLHQESPVDQLLQAVLIAVQLHDEIEVEA